MQATFKVKHKNFISFTACIIFLLIIFLLLKLPIKIKVNSYNNNIISNNSFIDDSGNIITINKQVNKIISLSAMHTENLYYIGAGNLLIGTDKYSNFPYQATKLERYDLKRVYDFNKMLLRKPDFIISEPSIIDSNRKLISKLETNGIKIVSLSPESLKDFKSYILKLGILTGLQLQTKSRLDKFNKDLLELENQSDTQNIKVYIEISEKGYITPTKNSLISTVIEFSMAELITPSTRWFNFNESTVASGFDFIRSNHNKIDYYLSLQGSGYSGASIESTKQKPNFKNLDFLKKDRVYEFPGALIDNYSFRLIDGIKEINRLVYSTNYTQKISLDKTLLRIDFAKYIYDYLNIQTYMITNKNYYESKKYSHTYGSFKDINFTNNDFNVVETIISKSYLTPYKDIKGNEYFKPNSPITRDDLLNFLFIYKNITKGETEQILIDLNLNKEKTYKGLDLINLIEFIKEY